MADLSFRERLPDYRNQYSRLKSKDAKKRFLDRIQAAYGYERKYLIKKRPGTAATNPTGGAPRSLERTSRRPRWRCIAPPGGCAPPI